MLDIETAPNKVYTWGLFKQNIALNQIVESGYTMCWAAKWHGSKKVMFSSLQTASEVEMLEEVHELLNEADAVCHYNGTNFDMPTLNKEFVLNQMPPPDPYHQIDLLRTARKRFRFTSNKLDYVAQALGLGGKVQHKGMDLWRECMAGNKKSWKVMEKYNKQDVQLLEKLYEEFLPWIQQHPNHSLYTDSDRPVCPNCGSSNINKVGTETTLTMTYQRYRCTKCLTPIRGRKNIGSKEQKDSTLTQSKI